MNPATRSQERLLYERRGPEDLLLAALVSLLGILAWHILPWLEVHGGLRRPEPLSSWFVEIWPALSALYLLFRYLNDRVEIEPQALLKTDFLKRQKRIRFEDCLSFTPEERYGSIWIIRSQTASIRVSAFAPGFRALSEALTDAIVRREMSR